MAVKILITLEGAEQINTALQDLTKKGEDFMQTFQNLGQGASPFGDVAVQMQTASENAGKGINQATEATHGFTEALRVVLPTLRLAGVEVGNFAGFARLATAGIGGLAVAIAGAVAVALANLEEQMRLAQSRLAGLFGSKELGTQAFTAIEDAAKSLGTTVKTLAPIFEAATSAFQHFQQTQQGFKFVALQGIDLPPGIVGNIKNTADAITNLIKVIRAGGQDEATAEKSALAFFNAIKEGGKVTADALKQMDPGAVRLLAEALGRGSITAQQFIAEVGLAPVPIDKLLAALDRFGPGAEKAFQATAVKSFKDSLQELLNAISEGFKGISGISFSEAIIAFLDKVKESVKATQAEVQLAIDTWKQFLALFPEKTPIVGGTQTVPLPPPRPPEAPLPGFIVPPAPEKIKEAIDKIDQEVTPEVDSLGKRWADTLFGTPVPNNQLRAAADAAVEAFQKALDFIKKGMAEALIAPAGAAEAQGPLLTQDQQTAHVEALVAPFQQADDEIRAIWIDLTDFVSTAFNDIDLSAVTQKLVQPFQDALSPIQQIIQQIIDGVNQALQQILLLQQAASQLSFAGFGGQAAGAPFASGGLVRGPGTQTSDSILAWLSNNEFIQPAKAVQFYGLDFMEAVRKMQLPRNFFEGFNMGGLVREMIGSIPKFAQGGQAQLTPITLVIDRQRFNMTATGDTVKALNRYAVSTQVTSGGRKPSWVR